LPPQLGIHLGLGIIAAIIKATIGALMLMFVIRLVRGGGGLLGTQRRYVRELSLPQSRRSSGKFAEQCRFRDWVLGQCMKGALSPACSANSDWTSSGMRALHKY
jgi:hypothetical protein